MNNLLRAFLPLVLFLPQAAFPQENTNQNLFRQLTEELPTPNQYRTATGRPGPAYFQQQVDYVMDVNLNEVDKTLSGIETITYHNNSPESLEYLYLQLDQNVREPNSFGSRIETSAMRRTERVSDIMKMNEISDGGFKIESVTGEKGNPVSTLTNHTIMKVILDQPLAPGKTTRISLRWQYKINNMKTQGGRSGYDPLGDPEEDIFAIAQFYPRLCVFNDLGWQIKQFIDAEFALEFGNFDVSITVPADHIVGATGELENLKEISATMADRLEQARNASKPVFIVTQEEAVAKENQKSGQTRKWHFKARNVRDFAFASSRKFIWDAMGVTVGKNRILAMSFFPKEANPLWSHYATKTIAHTIKTYSKYTFDYPYPVAQAVDASLGMEYPMIAFCGGRPNPDGSYDEGARNWVIGVVRHEVGHNFFPMIVNSDERQWAWMDEGFDIFMQGLAEREWDINQTWSGKPTEMIGYMNSDKNTQVPIMTDADALLQGGMNSYRKPAAGLNILRETILGRELFDQAFKEYARTWMFKHPQPADFFRIMEDASGVDLDWFWREWFFTTDYVDLAIKKVTVYEPVYDEESAKRAAENESKSGSDDISRIRDEGHIVSEIDRDTTLRDRYNGPRPLVSPAGMKAIKALYQELTPEEIAQLRKGQNFYQITFQALGGMIMPLVVRFEFTDGTSDEVRIPAEIWLKNQKEVSKVFIYDKEAKSIILDPYQETADVNPSNNFWPRQTERIFFNIRK
jgi:virulence-associated protein VagC